MLDLAVRRCLWRVSSARTARLRPQLAIVEAICLRIQSKKPAFQMAEKRAFGSKVSFLLSLRRSWCLRSLLRGVHRTGTTFERLVHKHFDFNAPIHLSAVPGLVVGDAVGVRQSRRSQDSAKRNIVFFEVADYGVCSPVAKLFIQRAFSSGVREAGYFNNVALQVFCLLDEVIQVFSSLSAQTCAARREVNSGRELLVIVVEGADAIVDTGNALVGLVGFPLHLGDLLLSLLLLVRKFSSFCLKLSSLGFELASPAFELPSSAFESTSPVLELARATL